MMMELNAAWESNGRVALFDTKNWQANDLSSDDVHWELYTRPRDHMITSPDGKKIIGSITLEGKNWFAWRDLDLRERGNAAHGVAVDELLAAGLDLEQHDRRA